MLRDESARNESDELKRDAVTEVWVDLERESAVVRLDHYVRGRPHITFGAVYSGTDTRWMPESWKVTLWGRPGGPPQFVEELRVVATDADPQLPPERFTAQLEPGMVYARGHGGGKPLERLVYMGKGQPPVEAHEYWRRMGWATTVKP